LITPSDFWTGYQPGFRFTEEVPGTPRFYNAVERHRYGLEPHIREIADFSRWVGEDVLDVGCGIATDGVQFARAGARYTGIDQSPTAIELARRRFELEGLDGKIVHGLATDLPFADESFDLVWSHGVIHHIADTQSAVDEFLRVLRPGGMAIVMLYHRRSFNYAVTIMGVRRLLAATLLIPGATRLVARVTREDRRVLEEHRGLLNEHRMRYLTDRQIFLSNNTDGPGNPLSKVYTRQEASQLFGRFQVIETKVRYLNVRLYPGGIRLEESRLGETLARRVGWHLYVVARK
jgi:2-polyprenyl-3-methyl-5-hydroxy-6-metoxy-1,4-benzoquinol methylase